MYAVPNMSAAEGFDAVQLDDTLNNNADRVTCEICSGMLLAKNLKRHQERYHASAEPPPDKVCKLVSAASPARSSDDDEPCQPGQSPAKLVLTVQQAAQPHSDESSFILSLPPYRRRPSASATIDRDAIDEAVSAILELHHDYSKETMLALLRRDFPEVPEELQCVFVDVATSAARYVAGVEEIARTYGGSARVADTEQARKAARSLTSWRLGPRRASVARRIWSSDATVEPAATPRRPAALSYTTSSEPALPRRQPPVIEPFLVAGEVPAPSLGPATT